MHGQLPHSFAVQCTMSEYKITKSMIAFKHIAQSILILTMQKYFLKNSFRLFLPNRTIAIGFGSSNDDKANFNIIFARQKRNILCTRDSNPSIKKSISGNVQNFRI